MKTTFKIIHSIDWGEYTVMVFEDGESNHKRTYFTDDKEDAKNTMKAMEEEEKRNTLRRRAIARFPDQSLTPLSDKTWAECFTIEELKAGKALIFWFNLPSGATHNESMILSNDNKYLKNIKKS